MCVTSNTHPLISPAHADGAIRRAHGVQFHEASVPYRSRRKQRRANRRSTAKWYQAHKAERAAYMRRYRRRRRLLARKRKPADPGVRGRLAD